MAALSSDSLLNPIKQKVVVEKSEGLAAAEGIKDWMISIRRQLINHENPEVGVDHCYQTSAELVKATLKGLQVYVHDDDDAYPDTGVVARIGSGIAPFVAIRGDMDALPFQEVTEWEHVSKVGGGVRSSGQYGAHTAMLLGAAKLLQERYQNKEFKGTVFLVFHPSKDEYAGASMMGAEEALKECQLIFGLMTNGLPASTWASKVGTVMARPAQFNVRIDGDVSEEAIDPNDSQEAKDQLAMVYGCTATVEFDPNHKYPHVVNNSEALEFLRGVVSEAIECGTVTSVSEVHMQDTPGVTLIMGCATSSSNEDNVYPLHMKFVIDENVLPSGATALTTTVLRYMANPSY